MTDQVIKRFVFSINVATYPATDINRMNSAIDSNAFWHTTVSTRLTLEGFIFTSPPQKNVETRPSGIRIPTGLKKRKPPVNPTKAG